MVLVLTNAHDFRRVSPRGLPSDVLKVNFVYDDQNTMRMADATIVAISGMGSLEPLGPTPVQNQDASLGWTRSQTGQMPMLSQTSEG